MARKELPIPMFVVTSDTTPIPPPGPSKATPPPAAHSYNTIANRHIMPTNIELVTSIVSSLILTSLSLIVVPSLDFAGSASYAKLWFIYMFVDAANGLWFHLIMLSPARWIAYRLPGSKMPPLDDEKKLSEQEEQSNDPSLSWPSADVMAKLPHDWVVQERFGNGRYASDFVEAVCTLKSHTTSSKRIPKKQKNKSYSNGSPHQHRSIHTNEENISTEKAQPYYLNHVRGSTRIRHASQRLAAAMGTLFSSYVLCSLSSLVTLDYIGLGISSPRRVLFDVICGFGIGSSIVIVLFLVELKMGWIKIVGYWETVVPEENFAVNITWDILFHVGVSFNEEVMLRGWMFMLGCRGIVLYSLEWFDVPSTAAAFAIAVSTILQSTLFSLLHLYSPGSTAVSLLNLFFGGIAATLNVLTAGGTVWLGIGWHFGWNIMMGHFLGRSTSGIPMSCAVVSVLPRPASSLKSSYEKYHGGTFGPEQGFLAPLAYILGMVMTINIYGWEELGVWKERLVLDSSNSHR